MVVFGRRILNARIILGIWRRPRILSPRYSPRGFTPPPHVCFLRISSIILHFLLSFLSSSNFIFFLLSLLLFVSSFSSSFFSSSFSSSLLLFFLFSSSPRLLVYSVDQSSVMAGYPLLFFPLLLQTTLHDAFIIFPLSRLLVLCLSLSLPCNGRILP